MSYTQLVRNQRTHFLSHRTRDESARREALSTLRKMVAENLENLKRSIYDDLMRDSQEPEHTIQSIERILNEYLKKWIKPEKIPSDPYDPTSDSAFVIRDPLGVVLMISPWNVPIYCSLVYVASAFAAGNTVILKPSEYAASFSRLIAKLVRDYFEPELFAVVEGEIPEVTSLLEERFDCIIYTGNPSVAKIVMTAAAKHLTPVILELGGKNPVYIDSTADLEDAAEKVVFSKLFNAGQACISSDYILITDDVKEQFIGKLKLAFIKHEPLKKDKLFARIINRIHFARLQKLITSSKGRLLYKGDEPDEVLENYFAPRILDVKVDDVLMSEEIFGPILPIVTVSSFEEAVTYINSKEKPLAAYIFTKNSQLATLFIKSTHSGGVTVNDVMKQVFLEYGPFGGVSNSGMGKVNGKFAFDNLTHARSILVRNGLDITPNL